MRIALAGPLETDAVACAIGIDPTGLPAGSVQTPLSLIAKGLLERGHEVHLITTDAQLEKTETHRRGALTLTYCPLRGAPRYRARVRSRDLFAKEISSLREAMSTSGAAIIHAHWTYEFAEAALRSRLPHLVTMHDLGWETFSQFRDGYRFMRLLMKYRTLPRVRNLNVVAPFMRNKPRQYGYFGEVKLVPNPVAETSWLAKSRTPPIIVCVGNGERLKNVATAVVAFAFIRREYPEAELHLFGPGLEPASALVDPANGIHGHGHTRHMELMRFLAEEATLLIHPSLLETFGVIVAEAKMRGVPVVAGRRSGGVAWVAGEGSGGVLTDVTDASAIAKASCDLLAHSDFQHLQRIAHEDMIRRFAVRSVVEQYEAIYSRIISSAK